MNVGPERHTITIPASDKNFGVQRTLNGVKSVTLTIMRRATVTIPDKLESALESYRRDLEFPPSLAALMQAALTEYLHQRGYVSRDDSGRQAGASRPSMYEDAPIVRGEKTAAAIVLEDRR